MSLYSTNLFKSILVNAPGRDLRREASLFLYLARTGDIIYLMCQKFALYCEHSWMIRSSFRSLVRLRGRSTGGPLVGLLNCMSARWQVFCAIPDVQHIQKNVIKCCNFL